MNIEKTRKIVDVININVSYGQKQILHNETFSIYEGECFCLLGPNGAGKTTTMKIITGMLQADSGSVTIHTNTHNELKNHKTKRIAIIPQYANLDPLLTVGENMIFFGLLQKMKSKDIREKMDLLLNTFGIDHLRKQMTFRCSGGECQRLLVARAFLHPSDIIFMDEPTAGVDILFKNQLWELFKKKKREGVTIYLNTHDLNEAEILSDRIGFLFNGRIITIDTPNRLKSLVRETRILITCNHPIMDSDQFVKYNYSINGCDLLLIVKTINSNVIKIIEEVSANNHIVNIEIKRPTLNDIFKKIGVKHGSNTVA